MVGVLVPFKVLPFMVLPPITLDKQLIKDLLFMKSAPALRIVLSLAQNLAETEQSISETFKQNSKTIRVIGQKLVDVGIIKIVIADGQVWYHLHKKYFDIESTCRNCKYKKETNVNGEVILQCSKIGKVCGHRHRLLGHNVAEAMKKHKAAYCEKYDKKIEKREFRHVDEWDYKDYITLYFEKFKENYPNLIAQELHEVRKNVKQLIKIFRESANEGWRRILKQYIITMFKEYKDNNKVVTFFSMIDKKDISKFLANYNKKIKKVEHCEIKGVLCSFCVGQKCNLPNGASSCTDGIVKKMRDKYN